MKNLQRLIKISKMEIDELRLELRRVQTVCDSFEEKIKKIDLAMTVEQDHVNSEMRGYLENFKGAMQTHKATLHKTLHYHRTQAETLGDTLREHFATLKRYELSLKNHQNLEEKIKKSAAEKEMDEKLQIKSYFKYIE